MSHPAGRVLALLELLQAHAVLSGRELARRLDVDERTVRRYVGTLADLGVPVTAARGRYGGYRLLPGYRLPPLMLTEDETVAVVLGLLAAERLGLVTGRQAGAGALAKLRRVLPRALAAQVSTMEESLEFTLRQPRTTPGAPTPVLLALGAAVAGRYRVRLSYRDWRGRASERELDPYGVVFHGGRWYVTGYDHARDAVRVFRLDRIAEVVPGTAPFEVPDGFDPVARVHQGLAAVPYRHAVSVLLETDPEQARRYVPASVGTLTPEAGGTRLECRAEDLDGMARMLAGLPCGYHIIAPDELRGALARHAARLADYAARRPD